MPNLTIKGLPDELHARLKERADRHRRNTNSEEITILERALTNRRPGTEEMIRRAEYKRRPMGKSLPSTGRLPVEAETAPLAASSYI